MGNQSSNLASDIVSGHLVKKDDFPKLQVKFYKTLIETQHPVKVNRIYEKAQDAYVYIYRMTPEILEEMSYIKQFVLLKGKKNVYISDRIEGFKSGKEIEDNEIYSASVLIVETRNTFVLKMDRLRLG
jgi:hypothetical protein